MWVSPLNLLQVLCAPCNQRKGIQTNEEFYARYRKAMREVRPGQLPRTPIPRARFKEETGRTHDQVQKFKRTKYISPATKIKYGSLAAGAACGIAWFLAWNLSFTEPSSLVGNISVFGGIASGLLAGAGLMVRAKVTGRYNQT